MLYERSMYCLSLSENRNLNVVMPMNRVFFLQFLLLLYVSVFFCPILTVSGECRFASNWTGTWFQSGIRHPIKIDGNFMTSKGTCIKTEGDKFMMEDRHERCYRCIVVHQKHENVLQYKETFCDSRRDDSLASMCSRINGDAQLYSMFRVNASPIQCPIRGPLTFSYNRGHGECQSPVSSVDSCIEDHRLLFRYQACPDVYGTESTVEELVCLGTWREGSIRYLVGRLEYNLATTDEDRFRCFVFAKTKYLYSMAQSGDATCSGLISPSDGPKTMKFNRASYPPSLCHFPPWAMMYGHKWHRLDGLKQYYFKSHNNNNNSFIIRDENKGVQEAHVRCLEETNIGNGYVAFTTHFIRGCTSGYVCMRFVKRGSHVMEVQKGNLSRYPNEACDAPFYDRLKSDYTTLVTSTPDRIRCPNKGQYVAPPIAAQLTTATVHTSLQGSGYNNNNNNKEKEHHQQKLSCSDSLTVRVGCAHDGDIMEFQDDCVPEPKTEAFHCHGAWDENGTSYLIASLKGTKDRYCFIYAEMDNMVKLTSVRKSCKRHVQSDVSGTFSFNVTSQGQCDPDYSSATSGSSRMIITTPVVSCMVWLVVMVVFSLLSKR